MTSDGVCSKAHLVRGDVAGKELQQTLYSEDSKKIVINKRFFYQ